MPKSEVETKFFTYCQNNSGGYDIGPAQYVIIEATSADEANRIAESDAGIYFDGVSTGHDCSCCGDRWREQWDIDDGYEMPTIYGDPLDMSNAVEEPTQEVSYAAVRFYGGKVLYVPEDERGKWR